MCKGGIKTKTKKGINQNQNVQDEAADGAEREHVQGPHRGARQGARQQPNLLHGERCRGQA